VPAAKKPRLATSTSKNPSMPTIHVTVNTGSNTSPPQRRSPLATITNIETPISPRPPSSPGPSADEIRYQPVEQILQLIDDGGRFADSPELTFPAVIFADTLHEFQITHVDQVVLLDADFYVHQVNMPLALAELFVSESFAAVGRAQKGKNTM
jgi:hypothetical protein